MSEEEMTAEEVIQEMKALQEEAKKMEIDSIELEIPGWTLLEETEDAYWYKNDAGEIVSVPK